SIATRSTHPMRGGSLAHRAASAEPARPLAAAGLRSRAPMQPRTEYVRGPVRELLTGEHAAVEDDRVLATVLFTDIVGSTEQASRLGDRAWRDLLTRHHALVRRQIAHFRGREVATAGDGF